MAVDDYTIEYHLTDEGWVPGSTTFFDKQDHYVERPAGTHETWVYRCYQKSQWSAEQTSWGRAWVNPESDPPHIAALKERFPSPKD